MIKNQKLKIGVVIDQLLPGGVQIAAIREVKELRYLGIKAELLILMRKRTSLKFETLVKGIPHRYLSDSYPLPFRNTIKFPVFTFLSTLHLLSPFLAPKIIKEGTYDLLISHGTTTCFTTLALWRQRHIPYLAIIHDPMVFILKKVYAKTILGLFFPVLIPFSYYLERAFVKEALSTVIVSRVHQDFIRKNYQVESTVLIHGCDSARQIPSRRGSFILAVSRWQKEKNPQFLLRLLKQMPGAKLKIAGNWTHESQLQDFKTLIKKLGLEKQVEIIPQFRAGELKKLFRQARVWIHPNFEAFGLGGLEAASNGVPIIIPAGSGITDLFKHGTHGFFPKQISVSEYKKYLDLLLSDQRLAYRMGRNAWLRVKNACSWQNHAENLLLLAQNQLSLLHLPKMTAIEIGHAGGTGLSGGDRLFEEMVKRMPNKFNLEVITSRFGSYHWQEANLKIKLNVIKPNPFEDKPDPISVFLSYLIRIAQVSFLLSHQSPKREIIYSSTNILPDIFPAFVAKLINSKLIWIARIHHLVPPPRQREGVFIVNVVSFLMQKLALFFMKARADLTIALNEPLYGYLQKIGFPKKRLTVLGAGIDYERINRYQPHQVKSFAGLYLGRLHVSKGIFDLVKIWKKVVNQIKSANLAIIGEGPTSIRNKLIKKIKISGLAKNIKILGYLAENRVYDFLKSGKIFLFPDHEAGWGLAVAEAMACGLPVVGYNIGILGRVYKAGFRRVKISDINSFSREVINLLENEDQRKKLAYQALNQAKYLSWEKTTKKFIKIIRRIYEP